MHRLRGKAGLKSVAPKKNGKVTRAPRVALLIESSRAAGRALLSGITRYANYHGDWSFFWEAHGLERFSAFPQKLDVEGVIMRDTGPVEQVRAQGLPVVVVGPRYREISGVVNVVADSDAIGRLGAEHLLSCGVRHFAFCGYEKFSWAEARRQAFEHVVSVAGFKSAVFAVPATVIASPWGNQRRAIAEWLRKLPHPLGLMVCNDDLGHEVIAACKLAGLSVPDDVAVVGVDNDEVVCGLSDPPLSSVGMNFERAGYEAAYVLDGLMRRKNGSPSHIIVEATHVFARRSTSLLAVEDGNLAKALRFLRDHSSGNISVQDVARASGISRRALERRFRDSLGRSVLQEIRRVRVDQIARLLIDTDMTINQIGEQLKFIDVQHIARYFRMAKKMSPLAYRKLHAHKPASAPVS